MSTRLLRTKTFPSQPPRWNRSTGSRTTKTPRKTIVTLVVASAAAIGYLGVSPGTLKAATDVEADWDSSRGAVTLHQDDNNLVWGTLGGPLGEVHVLGHFDGPRILRLAFKGV